jgi:hypothetical protein
MRNNILLVVARGLRISQFMSGCSGNATHDGGTFHSQRRISGLQNGSHPNALESHRLGIFRKTPAKSTFHQNRAKSADRDVRPQIPIAAAVASRHQMRPLDTQNVEICKHSEKHL